MKTIDIAGRKVGLGHPSFIIAEAGVNHNGDPELARKLIFEAKECGADCIKFQTFKAERVITRDAPKAAYQLKTTDSQESQIEMLRSLELPFDAYRELIELANDLDMVFMSTPYNQEDVDFLDELGVPAFKLASIHLFEPSFLQYVARKGKPMIISTGMATLSDVDIAVRAVRETGNDQIVLLQCTTNYPSRLEDANLRAMQTMREALDVLVGYSDHTQADTACMVSVALGACVIEKHFTVDKSLPGPDQSTSYDSQEFRHLVQGIREVEKVLGSGIKVPSQIELANAKGMRRSIVARRTLYPGEILTEKSVAFKRPGTGLAPGLLSMILGRRILNKVDQDSLLDLSDLGELDDPV